VTAFGKAVQLLSESGQEAAAAWALCGIARAKSTLSPRLVRWLEDFFALARLRRFTRADLADLKSRLQEVSPLPVAAPMDLEPVSCSFEIRITLTFEEAEDGTGAGDARPEHFQCLL
jgi:hypothetical protein